MFKSVLRMLGAWLAAGTRLAVIVLAVHGGLDLLGSDDPSESRRPSASRAAVAAIDQAHGHQAYLPRLEGGEHDLALRVARLEALLEHFRRNGDDVIITGANLWINNGTGTTDAEQNGLGNLVLGYNESRGEDLDQRSGSHSLVLGTRNNFTGFASVVAGELNTVEGAYTTITGGRENYAGGFHSAICGGFGGWAEGETTSISGGFRNEATGDFSVVSGGRERSADLEFNWAAGSLLEER